MRGNVEDSSCCRASCSSIKADNGVHHGRRCVSCLELCVDCPAPCAARADVDLMFCSVKDAADNGVDFSVDAGDDTTAALQSIDKKALDTVIAERKWAALPSTRKHHRMRRAIDRRFSGTPERRTRSFHMFDDY